MKKIFKENNERIAAEAARDFKRMVVVVGLREAQSLYDLGLYNPTYHFVALPIPFITFMQQTDMQNFKDKEIVICAAIKAPDGSIFRGHRHVHAARAMREKPGYENVLIPPEGQGFITSRNRYVTRKEGCEIQKAAGIESHDKKHPYLGGELYSEDLY